MEWAIGWNLWIRENLIKNEVVGFVWGGVWVLVAVVAAVVAERRWKSFVSFSFPCERRRVRGVSLCRGTWGGILQLGAYLCTPFYYFPGRVYGAPFTPYNTAPSRQRNGSYVIDMRIWILWIVRWWKEFNYILRSFSPDFSMSFFLSVIKSLMNFWCFIKFRKYFVCGSFSCFSNYIDFYYVISDLCFVHWKGCFFFSVVEWLSFCSVYMFSSFGLFPFSLL